MHGYDPLRLAVDVRGTGGAAYRGRPTSMRRRDDINLELAAEAVVVAVFGMGETAHESPERLVTALRHAIDELDSAGAPAPTSFPPPPHWGRSR